MNRVVDNAEHCLFCNVQIPEGWQVCPICEAKLSGNVKEGVKEIIEKESRKED